MKRNGILVGLTGQTGAGKTTVSTYLREKGYSVIDADVVARQVVGHGSRCLLELVLAFGVEILQPDGTLNRGKLGDMVFEDVSKRKVLNRITFPYIQEEIFSRVERHWLEGTGIVFLDAPTLIESGTHEECDQVVSIIAPEELRRERILSRDNITIEQANARIHSQHEDDFYTEQSDYVLINDKDASTLFGQVDWMLTQLKSYRANHAAQAELD